MLAALALTALGFASAVSRAAEPKKVLTMISEAFWAPEYYEPQAVYDKADFQVTVAAKYSDPVHPDRRNWAKYKPVKPDVTFNKVDVANYDAVTAAGGNGSWQDLLPNDDVHRIVADSFKRKKITALLCTSTGLLATVNNFSGEGTPIAEGHHVTGYYRVEGLLRKLGRVNYDPGEKDKPYVVVDGDLITGRDPISATLFGETVANKLAEAAP